MKKLYVICPDMTCFYVDADTLEPFNTGGYDPYAISDPVTDAESISHGEWNRRLGKLRREKQGA